MKSSLPVLILSVSALMGLACIAIPSNPLSFHLLLVGLNAVMSAVLDGALGELAGDVMSQPF